MVTTETAVDVSQAPAPARAGRGEPLSVLVSDEPIEPPDRERIEGAFPEVRVTFAKGQAEMLAAAPDAEVIFSKMVSREMLAAARRLRWAQAGTAGVDGWIRAGIRDLRVVLTNAHGAHGIPMSENILCMAFCFATRMHLLIRGQKGRAKIGRQVVHAKWELEGQTMLVLGLGDVGGTLAMKAKASGMRVLGVRRSRQPFPYCDTLYTPDRLPEALPLADHVALCLPLTPETDRIIGERELRLMKPTAHIYNVGRGASIEPVALRRALAEGWIAGAGLDCVAPSDTPADDDPLWDMDNVILSLHSSGHSPANSQRITDIFLENLGRYLRGEPLINVIDQERGY